MSQRRTVFVLLLAPVLLAGAAALFAQAVTGPRPTFESAGGTRIEMLLDEELLGGREVEIAEITFPPNARSGDHVHGSTEIFYVLEGELEHIVNGESHVLRPGMLGFVRPPDRVDHKVGPDGCRALVIWAPGGEGARIVANWKRVENEN